MRAMSRPLARSRPPCRALRHAPAAFRDLKITPAQATPFNELPCPLDDDEADFDSPSSSTSTSSPSLPLLGRRVLITAPRAYAASLGSRLLSRGAKVLSVPGVRTVRLRRGSGEERELDGALRELLGLSPSSSPDSPPFAAVAFTSRAGIEACLERIAALVGAPRSTREEALAAGGAALAAAAARSGGALLFWALGADAGALLSAGVPAELVRKPKVASTKGMVSSMASFSIRNGTSLTSESFYRGKRVLCPVPSVVGGLDEPPVVPRFLEGLSEVVGAVPVRVPAYTTAPAPDLVLSDDPAADRVAPSAGVEIALLHEGHVDAIVFSSTAEAQGLDMAAGGLLVSFIEEGNKKRRRRSRKERREANEAGDVVGRETDSDVVGRETNSDVVLAAHGPQTAEGASRVLRESAPWAPEACTKVTVVPDDFSSFAGVVDALEEEFRRRGG